MKSSKSGAITFSHVIFSGYIEHVATANDVGKLWHNKTVKFRCIYVMWLSPLCRLKHRGISASVIYWGLQKPHKLLMTLLRLVLGSALDQNRGLRTGCGLKSIYDDAILP